MPANSTGEGKGLSAEQLWNLYNETDTHVHGIGCYDREGADCHEWTGSSGHKKRFIEAYNALPAADSALRLKLEQLDFALQAGTTRYSRDHGEPEPTPSFPVEVVFTIGQWDAVLKALSTLLTEESSQVEKKEKKT